LNSRATIARSVKGDEQQSPHEIHREERDDERDRGADSALVRDDRLAETARHDVAQLEWRGSRSHPPALPVASSRSAATSPVVSRFVGLISSLSFPRTDYNPRYPSSLRRLEASLSALSEGTTSTAADRKKRRSCGERVVEITRGRPSHLLCGDFVERFRSTRTRVAGRRKDEPSVVPDARGVDVLTVLAGYDCPVYHGSDSISRLVR
jgi:hypothetical protein